jgi:bacterioferritin-associated ferredoxin
MFDAPCCTNSACGQCPGDYVCHCLKITEEMVEDAIAAGARTLSDLRVDTGAGDGCTACHVHLKAYLARAIAADAARGMRSLVMA